MARRPARVDRAVHEEGEPQLALAGLSLVAAVAGTGGPVPARAAIPPVPAGGAVGVLSRTSTGSSAEFRAGRVVALVLERDADGPGDNCSGDVTLSSFLATC